MNTLNTVLWTVGLVISTWMNGKVAKQDHKPSFDTGRLSDTSLLTKPDYLHFPLADWEKKFKDFQFKALRKSGKALPYRYYEPDSLSKNEKVPLVIFMHGAGERGFDNRKQFFRFNPFEFWKKYKCFVVAPQCPEILPGGKKGVWVDTPFGDRRHVMQPVPTWELSMAADIIRHVLKNKHIDHQRVYITGLSMGGFATWEILERQMLPITAAIPISGGGDTAQVKSIKRIPIWVFHGDADSIVPVGCSRDMVSALHAVGIDVRYTELPNTGHDAWSPTYRQEQVWDWLFQQRSK